MSGKAPSVSPSPNSSNDASAATVTESVSHDTMQSRTSGSSPAASSDQLNSNEASSAHSTELLSSASSTPLEQNSDFDLYTLPVEQQFKRIEKEFATIEERTMNPKLYNFTTSLSFPTKNRYINVMANEGTLFPPPKSSLAVRSSAQPSRSTESRLLNSLCMAAPFAVEDSPSAGSDSIEDDSSNFKMNSLTANGKEVPLYINGNVVDVGAETVFIASQAPVLDCMEDFLNTVYNCRIPLILMLTELQEAGFAKADRYWPQDKAKGYAGEVFGNMCVYKDPSDPYTVDAKHELIHRPVFVRPCTAPKSMRHKVLLVQYVGWPDRGVPDSTESFEELLHIIDTHGRPNHTQSSNGKAKKTAASTTADARADSNRPEHRRTASNATSASASSGARSAASSATGSGRDGRPLPSVLVHCSAGIGRSGTLIGAYGAVKRMLRGQLHRDSIPQILSDMRRARFGMVQRIEQYMFLYLIVLRHLGVDTTAFVAQMQPRADLYNFRWMEARQKAMLASRAARQQQQQTQ